MKNKQIITIFLVLLLLWMLSKKGDITEGFWRRRGRRKPRPRTPRRARPRARRGSLERARAAAEAAEAVAVATEPPPRQTYQLHQHPEKPPIKVPLPGYAASLLYEGQSCAEDNECRWGRCEKPWDINTETFNRYGICNGRRGFAQGQPGSGTGYLTHR